MPRQKPARPVLYRSHSLFHGLLYSSAIWEKGPYPGGTQNGIADDITKLRGDWFGSLDSANYTVDQFGRAATDGGASRDKFIYTRPAGTDYWATPQQISYWIHTRPRASDQPADACAFSRRQSNVGTTQGWDLQTGSGPSPDVWLSNISDGVSVLTCAGSKSITIARAQSIVVTYDGATMNQYVDGSVDGTASGALGSFNAAMTMVLFGYDNSGVVLDRYDGIIFAAGIWNRALTSREAGMLASDPYIMWRNGYHNEFMFGPGMPLGGLSTYFLSF